MIQMIINALEKLIEFLKSLIESPPSSEYIGIEYNGDDLYEILNSPAVVDLGTELLLGENIIGLMISKGAAANALPRLWTVYLGERGKFYAKEAITSETISTPIAEPSSDLYRGVEVVADDQVSFKLVKDGVLTISDFDINEFQFYNDDFGFCFFGKSQLMAMLDIIPGATERPPIVFSGTLVDLGIMVSEREILMTIEEPDLNLSSVFTFKAELTEAAIQAYRENTEQQVALRSRNSGSAGNGFNQRNGAGVMTRETTTEDLGTPGVVNGVPCPPRWLPEPPPEDQDTGTSTLTSANAAFSQGEPTSGANAGLDLTENYLSPIKGAAITSISMNNGRKFSQIFTDAYVRNFNGEFNKFLRKLANEDSEIIATNPKGSDTPGGPSEDTNPIDPLI